MARCVAEIDALESLALASADSARDWSMHSAAQIEYEEGRYTLTQAEAHWAESKARGADDLKAFGLAQAAATTTGGCESPIDEQSTAGDEAVGICLDRYRALQDVAEAGAVVNDQWAEHLAMMATRDDAEPAAYHQRWLQMAHDARPALATYRAASTTATDTPSCAA